MPLMQIIPPDPDSGSTEHEVRSIELPGEVLSPEQRAAQFRERSDVDRRGERYGELVAHPTSEEGRFNVAHHMTPETLARLQADDEQKRAVPNVVTTHSDVAKVAGGDGSVELVPTVAVYREDDPTGQGLVVDDPTVHRRGVAEGTTVLDRAEATLEQPRGDEYSTSSATGPTLPEGVVLQSLADGETTEPAHSVEDSPGEIAKATHEAAVEAAAAAQKVTEEVSEAQKASAVEAEAAGATGVVGEKSTDPESGSHAARSGSEGGEAGKETALTPSPSPATGSAPSPDSIRVTQAARRTAAPAKTATRAKSAGRGGRRGGKK